MKFLMYGAGNIGRGFIGQVFSQAGYQVTFVDIDTKIVDEFNRRKSYPVNIVGNEPKTLEISNICAINGMDSQAVVNAICECDLMATSLGAAALERVAPIIAQGFAKRMDAGGSPLNILICENLKDSAHLLHDWITKSIDPSHISQIYDNLGLVEAAISRMVPVNVNEDILAIDVEKYDFLPIDCAAFKGEVPSIPQLVPYTPFSFYEDRKLYLHNMGHAVCGYLGNIYGYKYIWEAISDPWIRLLVQNAMTESASMLSVEYSQRFSTIFNHGENLICRFQNKALGDTCERVTRDPMRKLATSDRLIAPLKNCYKNDIPATYLASAVAVAVYDLTKNPSEAKNVLREHSLLPEALIDAVMKLYDKLSVFDAQSYFKYVESQKHKTIENQV